MQLFHLFFHFFMVQQSIAAVSVKDGVEGDVKPLKEGVTYLKGNGKYMLPKFGVSVVSIFASSTITAESEEKFYITLANSTEMEEDKGIWWRALFLRESFLKYKKKVSPFEDLYIKIEFVLDTNVVDLKIKFTSIDVQNIYWFVAGIILFFIARTLSRSVVFHYSSGASIGMLMSWMIVLVLLYRLLPYRRAMTTLLVTGTGAGFYFTEMLFNKGYSLVLQYPYEVIGVCSFFGVLSMALIYYFGPPATDKSYNLIQWSLQMCAIYIIYQSSSCKEFSITIIITVMFLQFISYNFFIRIIVLITPRRVYYFFNRPKQRRLLTMEEYEEEGRVTTEKALKELTSFCNSPDCNSWKVVSRLKDPKRFATYLNENKQFTDDELDAYDQFDTSLEPNNLFDADNDSDSLDSAISETWLTDDDLHRSP